MLVHDYRRIPLLFLNFIIVYSVLSAHFPKSCEAKKNFKIDANAISITPHNRENFFYLKGILSNRTLPTTATSKQ
jgi:hypothetical protein